VNYRTRLQEYIRLNAKPPDKFSHQARLYALAHQLGQAEGKPFDDDVVFAASWLHDLGVFIGHRPENLQALERWDHIAYAVAKAPGILRESGFPEDRIPAVCEAIRTHLPTSSPSSFEGTLLREADILEQLGAVGILRTVSKIGRDTRFKLFSDALRVLRNNLEQLPGRLTLASARQLAERRVRVLKTLLTAAEEESEGIDL
jgi:uncharacterized protein